MDAVAAALIAAPDIFSDDSTRARRALAGVIPGLERAGVRAVATLDRAMRDTVWHRRLSIDFAALPEARVASLAGLDPEGWALGLASTVRDGYVREAAVRALGERWTLTASRFLILRANDPVIQISTWAAVALEARLNAENLDLWARCLPLLQSARSQVRASEAAVLERAAAALRAEPGHGALRQALGELDPLVRRGASEVLVDALAGTRAVLEPLSVALAAVDPQLRRWGARAVATVAITPPEIVAILRPRLAADGDSGVRALATQLAARAGDVDALRVAAFDVNADVRFRARQYLIGAGVELDTRVEALERLEGADRKGCIAALATLSDTGVTADLPSVTPFLVDPRASVAREAARTVEILNR